MSEYFGFRQAVMSDEEIAAFYENSEAFGNFDCLINEYLLIQNRFGEDVDQYRWSGSEFIKVPFKQINSRFVGKIKPRNLQQQLALDLLYNNDITVKVLTGKFGTGKDYLMASAAIDLTERGKYERLLWVRNNVEVKNNEF